MNQQDVIYPGHPIAIALMIVETFPSLTAATTIAAGRCYCNALGSDKVPGAGGNVHDALDLLTMIVHGERSFAAAFQRANRCWAHCDDQQDSSPLGRLRDRWQRGQVQADALTQKLADTLLWWPL